MNIYHTRFPILKLPPDWKWELNRGELEVKSNKDVNVSINATENPVDGIISINYNNYLDAEQIPIASIPTSKVADQGLRKGYYVDKKSIEIDDDVKKAFLCAAEAMPSKANAGFTKENIKKMNECFEKSGIDFLK